MLAQIDKPVEIFGSNEIVLSFDVAIRVDFLINFEDAKKIEVPKLHGVAKKI